MDQKELDKKYEEVQTIFNDGHHNEAFLLYKELAEHHYADAQYSLGFCYDYGYGVEANQKMAAKWYGEAFRGYQKGAEEGQLHTYYSLGCCYFTGTGVKQDTAKAFEYFLKAAEQGHIDSCYNVGSCYFTGTGVEKEKAKAFEWSSKAAECGHEQARKILEYLKDEDKMQSETQKNYYMINMQKILFVASELHRRGYEKLHVIPSISPNGMNWRCKFVVMENGKKQSISVSNWISKFISNENEEIKQSDQELSDILEKENDEFLTMCKGEDHEYVEWYREMLRNLQEGELPYAFDDYFLETDTWETSLSNKIKTLSGEDK